MEHATHLSHLIVLGSGTSEGIPRVTCLTKKSENNYCQVCHDANPFKSEKLDNNNNKRSKNFRRNTSLLLKITNPNPHKESQQDKTHKTPFYHVLIDCGKFFYPSAMEWFPMFNITHLDSVIISHCHADASFGIDDLRDWCLNVEHGGTVIPVYMTKEDTTIIVQHFPYFQSSVENAKQIGGGIPALKNLEMVENKPIEIVPNYFITVFTVNHGLGNSLGFLLAGPNNEKIIWCSDVKFVPEENLHYFENLDILFLDLLFDINQKKHPSHFCYEDSIEFIRKFKPKHTYFVGMNHTVDHTLMNEKLKNEFKNEIGKMKVELGYDGLCVEF
ncbi:unnamed protein product [Didymodactylos carnosus]|uniref:Metallo-beta-lactamase domain-containing protein n=1 Tax=Didymodactylos carnosus TaxID=1234261 RepID=A0A815IQK0_9BILA|nr:unnamed protein product [Didymodactylos carnosus]CAF4253626.1 unnamed protein product [Didymodactylos carnosus]